MYAKLISLLLLSTVALGQVTLDGTKNVVDHKQVSIAQAKIILNATGNALITGDLEMGADGTDKSKITLFGDGALVGPEIILYNSDGEDTDSFFFTIEADDQFKIKDDTATLMTIDENGVITFGSGGSISAPLSGQFQIGNVGATYSALNIFDNTTHTFGGASAGNNMVLTGAASVGITMYEPSASLGTYIRMYNTASEDDDSNWFEIEMDDEFSINDDETDDLLTIDHLGNLTIVGMINGVDVSAVAANYIKIDAAAASSQPSIISAGSDTDIDLELDGQGAGVVKVLDNLTVVGTINGVDIDDITVANLANGTDGSLITWDTDGAPIALAPGTAGSVLQTNGADNLPTWVAGYMQNLSDDTSPELAANLEISNKKLISSGYIILDFLSLGTPTNYLQIATGTTGNPAIIAGAGSDDNVGVRINTKGSGVIHLDANVTVTGTVDGVDIDARNTNLATAETTLADIPVANLANGTDGSLITWSTSAAPTIITPGTSGYVLTSSGPDEVPVWAAASGGGDHGALTGRSDDDHPQYARLASASNVFTGTAGIGGSVTSNTALTLHNPSTGAVTIPLLHLLSATAGDDVGILFEQSDAGDTWSIGYDTGADGIKITEGSVLGGGSTIVQFKTGGNTEFYGNTLVMGLSASADNQIGITNLLDGNGWAFRNRAGQDFDFVSTNGSGTYSATVYTIDDSTLNMTYSNDITAVDLTATGNIIVTGSVDGIGDLYTDVNANTAKVGVGTDVVDIAHLSATGTAGTTTFLRGDNDWSIPDHGGLTGLGDSDHPQYALLAGATFTSNLDVQGVSIIGSGDNAIPLTIRRATGDVGAYLDFKLQTQNASSSYKNTFRIRTTLGTRTAGAEESNIIFEGQLEGAGSNWMRVHLNAASPEVSFNDSSDDINFAVRNSSDADMFHLDAATSAATFTGTIYAEDQFQVKNQSRYSEIDDLGTAVSAESWDIADTQPMAKILLGGTNTTITLSAADINTNGTITVTQGSTARTITWAATDGSIKWPAGTAPDLTTVNSIHVISFMSYDGTNYVGAYLSNIS